MKLPQGYLCQGFKFGKKFEGSCIANSLTRRVDLLSPCMDSNKHLDSARQS